MRNEYSYDRMGNRSGTVARNITDTGRSESTYAVNTLNQVQSIASRPFSGTTGGAITTTNYTYDANGNLATQSTSANSSGNTYSYDDADRLSSFVSRTSTGANNRKSDWVYDGLSRKKTLRESSWNGMAWVLNSMKSYIYDGMDVVQERESLFAADGVTVTSSTQTNFTRTGNIGGILAKSTGTTTQTHLFFHYDGSGNVVGLSDSAQNSVAEYSYDSYGNTLTANGAQAASNAYRYSTKELHSFSGLYDYGFRFYSPGLGRWINRDPIGESGGLNLYAFGPNSPVNGFDPYGMDWVDNTSNFFAGAGDNLSFGATGRIRQWMGTDDVVDRCSGWYGGGQAAGTGLGLAMGGAGAAGAVKGAAGAVKSGRFAERLFLSGRFGVTSTKFGNSGANVTRTHGTWNVPRTPLKVGWSGAKTQDGQAFRIGIGVSKTKPNQSRFHIQIPGTTVKNAFANGAMEVKRSLSKLDNSVSRLDEFLSGIR